MSKSRSLVNIGLVNVPLVPILIGSMLIGRIIKSIHQAEIKIVHYHSTQLPVLMILEATSEPEKNTLDTGRAYEEDLELLETSIRCRDTYITIS